MLADRITLALDRIERATGRIETATTDVGEQEARYQALRQEAGRALAELDALIGRLEP